MDQTYVFPGAYQRNTLQFYNLLQTTNAMIVKLTYFGAEFETECDVSTCFYRSSLIRDQDPGKQAEMSDSISNSAPKNVNFTIIFLF